MERLRVRALPLAWCTLGPWPFSCQLHPSFPITVLAVLAFQLLAKRRPAMDAADRYPASAPTDFPPRTTAGWPWLANAWDCLLRLLLVFWIVRVPLSMTLLGLALLGLTPQAQDLFTEFARTGWLWMLWFLVVLIFVWAMPTHYAARLLLDTDSRFRLSLVATPDGHERCSQVSALWVPRALGMLTFVAVLFAIGRSYRNLPTLDHSTTPSAVHRALIEMAIIVIIGAAAFFSYMLWRPYGADLPLLRLLKPVNRLLTPVWRTFSPGLQSDCGTEDELSRDVGRLLLVILFVLFVVTFAWGAENVARAFPRAIAVPFILGGWLPFLSYFSGVGRQWRAPLIVAFFAAIAIAAVILGDNHSVRLINATNKAGHAVDTASLPLESAVSLWKDANGCTTSNSCARPVIIAAAGGASRAAYFTASMLGYLLDPDESGLDPDKVRNRLFAISGVSGGSVGAVMVTAALAEANGAQHPCKATDVPLWWSDKIKNWRDCLEALTSGDFLTADFLGFAFNDMVPFAFFRDRAAVLEDSWSKHYDEVIANTSTASTGECHGLECPFFSLRPTSARWIPLLVLNGTSEATGGRIITTILSPTFTPSGSCPTVNDDAKCRIFVQADRFHDLLSTPGPRQGWTGWFERYWLGHADVDDIRLSTAAHNSARFPFISPAGTIRDSKDQMILDRIVDGGYFENYGALSAKELALAVHAVDPHLSPLVVVISNDPDDLLNADDDATRTSAPAKAIAAKALLAKQKAKARTLVSGSEPVTDLVTPIKTIANARTAHGLLGVEQLDSALRDALPRSCEGLIQVRVWPQPEDNTGSGRSKAVSMSWWLSAPIQEHLHQQTAPQQSGDNTPHLRAILKQMAAPPNCAEASSR